MHIDNLPIGWMSVAVFGLVYLATAIIFAATFQPRIPQMGGSQAPAESSIGQTSSATK